MARRRKRLNPLLYIDQPTYQEVATSMQNKFKFNDQEQGEEKENQQPEESAGESSVAVDTLENSSEESSERVGEIEKKPFKEMSIEEKIGYLAQFPASIVKIQYSFITSESRVVGYFISKEDDYITVFPRNKRKPVKILIENIQDIKVSGL
ncbi:CotO family spore coat protein [Mesobacillus jeotgali]|uniref:CotO family spore coat protein n=1 Tax=Mesobacillus jeotgali TaxID=129985 RepID=UPI00177ADE2D|nr:CotO family spore coat protein [Mesobacillus jeotgali]UYZ23251.1 spore coat CotO family protein [Mesobacillus jeotgali]